MPFELLVRGASEVITATGLPSEPAEQALRPAPGAAVGISQGIVRYLGPESALPHDAVGPLTEVVEARGGFVGPGFVDPHTHVVFAGERSNEFELRNRGATYLELAQAGGGIMSTVRATRATGEDELVALALPRLSRLLSFGVTTAEVKSGYGLNLEDELKLLRAIRRLGTLQPIELCPTLLCAHAIPEEHRGTRERYVALCLDEIIPRVGREVLATFCDVFVEQGAFTLEEGERLLGAGQAAGLTPRLHADQLSPLGGALLAAKVKASSADHLEHITEEGIQALAQAGVSAVLVPTSSLFVHARPYAPGRRLREAGVNVALGTNVNPGSAMSESVPLTMGLACLENGLSAAEAYWGFTRGAALALRLQRAGKLEVGGPADLVVFSCASYRHLPYHLGINHVRQVVKRGRRVHSGEEMPLCT